MPNSEKKKLKTSEILFPLSGIIFILLICTTVFLLIKINVLETKFESLNEKTTKMEKDLNWVSHHLLISE